MNYNCVQIQYLELLEKKTVVWPEIVPHTLTHSGSESALGHAKTVRGTSGVLCFGHGQPSISSLHLTLLWRHELLQFLRLGQSLFGGCHSLHDQFQSATSSSHLSVQDSAWKQMSVTPPLTSSSFSWWGGGLHAYRPSLCLCVCPQTLPLASPFSTPTHHRSHPPHHQVHSTMMLFL